MNDAAHILLLAAGASRRMGGRDKLAEPVDGVALLRRQAEVALSTGCPVTVALPPNGARDGLLEGLALNRLHLKESLEDMSGTLRAAIAHLAASPRVLLMLADMPDIDAADLNAVLAGPEHHPDALIWRAATEDGKPGHPILFDSAIYPAFASLRGDGGGTHLMEAAKGRVALIPLPGQRARCDLDTPEDWAEWRARRGGR